jgi:hypothetical protein
MPAMLQQEFKKSSFSTELIFLNSFYLTCAKFNTVYRHINLLHINNLYPIVSLVNNTNKPTRHYISNQITNIDHIMNIQSARWYPRSIFIYLLNTAISHEILMPHTDMQNLNLKEGRISLRNFLPL